MLTIDMPQAGHNCQQPSRRDAAIQGAGDRSRPGDRALVLMLALFCSFLTVSLAVE